MANVQSQLCIFIKTHCLPCQNACFIQNTRCYGQAPQALVSFKQQKFVEDSSRRMPAPISKWFHSPITLGKAFSNVRESN